MLKDTLAAVASSSQVPVSSSSSTSPVAVCGCSSCTPRLVLGGVHTSTSNVPESPTRLQSFSTACGEVQEDVYLEVALVSAGFSCPCSQRGTLASASYSWPLGLGQSVCTAAAALSRVSRLARAEARRAERLCAQELLRLFWQAHAGCNRAQRALPAEGKLHSRLHSTPQTHVACHLSHLDKQGVPQMSAEP